jgi:PAS domain S-box-containing protein
MLERDLFTLLENTADATFTVTEEGQIVSWNKGAERVFGFSASEVLQRTCYEVLEGMGPLGTRVCHQHCSVVECSGGNIEIPNFDMNVKVSNGDRVWVNISTLVCDNQRTGRRLLVHIARDITKQKKTEDLVHRMLDFSKELSGVTELAVRPEPIAPLSDQEKHILRLFAEGKDSGRVARKLGISGQTLRNHLHHINQKLRTHNRLEAVMNALQRRLI